MREDFSKYESLIKLMEATPKANVSEGFTEKVMGRLPEFDQGVWARVKHSLLNPSRAGVQSRWAQIMTVSDKREGSFCFFITGYFYLILGIVLMMGFKAIGPSMSTMDWIKLQPHLTIGVAIWLLALGMVLMMDGRIAIKIAKYGTWFYIFFAVINGILMWDYLHLPYAGVLLISFEAMSVLMGVMLVFAAKKMESRQV